MMRIYIVLLCVAASVWAESSENYQTQIRPHAQQCKEKYGATDDDVNALVLLRTDTFTTKAKCLSECVLERLGVMKDGKYTPSAEREVVYRRLFQDDPRRLDKTIPVIRNCAQEAEEKFPKDGCEVAYYGFSCLVQKTL